MKPFVRSIRTISAVYRALPFGLYPQAYFPQLCITAVVVPGNELGDVGAVGERFLDNKCIEGSIPEMLDDALVHRDYSIHTEGMPIQILMFDDRMEIHNPGGIYGRLKIDQLGKMQPDTRNPVLDDALEVLGVTENRYSGIPTIRRENLVRQSLWFKTTAHISMTCLLSARFPGPGRRSAIIWDYLPSLTPCRSTLCRL